MMPLGNRHYLGHTLLLSANAVSELYSMLNPPDSGECSELPSRWARIAKEILHQESKDPSELLTDHLAILVSQIKRIAPTASPRGNFDQMALACYSVSLLRLEQALSEAENWVPRNTRQLAPGLKNKETIKEKFNYLRHAFNQFRKSFDECAITLTEAQSKSAPVSKIAAQDFTLILRDTMRLLDVELEIEKFDAVCILNSIEIIDEAAENYETISRNPSYGFTNTQKVSASKARDRSNALQDAAAQMLSITHPRLGSSLIDEAALSHSKELAKLRQQVQNYHEALQKNDRVIAEALRARSELEHWKSAAHDLQVKLSRAQVAADEAAELRQKISQAT